MSNDTAAPLGGPHSAAWIAQAQISFGIACSAMIIGVAYLPVDRWIRAFLGLGLRRLLVADGQAPRIPDSGSCKIR